MKYLSGRESDYVAAERVTSALAAARSAFRAQNSSMSPEVSARSVIVVW